MFKKNLIQIHVALALGLSSSVAYSACTASGDTLTCINQSAIWSSNSSGFNIADYDKVVISTSATASISGPSGWGVYSAGNPMTFKELDITTAGGKADGIVTKNGRTSITVDKLTVITSGSSADGINLGKESNNTTITVGNGAYIDAKGMGVRANTSANTAGENLITVGSGATIISRENGSNAEIGSYEFGTGYTVYAGNTNSAAVGDARVVIGDDSTLTSHGRNAHVVYANKGGVIELGSTNITALGTGSHGIYAEEGSKSGGTVGSQVYLLGDTEVTIADNTKYAIYAKGANSEVSSYNQHTGLATSGVFKVNGNVRAEAGGKVDLVMTDNSRFIGNTSLSGAGSTLNLNITGTNSVWQMSESSELSTLTLTNGANVYLTDHSTGITNSPAANNITLTMEHLKGTGGVFYLRTDVIGSNCSGTSMGDLIRVTGTSQGHHKIFVNDGYNGSATVDGSERLKVVETADGGAEFSLYNVGGSVDIGAYQYTLSRGNNLGRTTFENWWLSSRGQKTNTADSSGNILNINYLLNYVENQTLLQRLGELRRHSGTEGDLWVRGYVGKLSSFEDSALSGFDMNYDGVQIGVDKYVGNDFYVGMVMGSAKAEVDYEIGNGRTQSHHLGIYGTYKTENGWYVDSIAKLVYMNNKFDTESGGGFAIRGNGNTHGYSAGVEVGKRFYLQSQAGWYVEPQAQFTYSHQNSATVKATNGLKTRLDEFDSLVGRASAIVGYSVADGKYPVDIYLKTGYVKEFDGKTGYTYNDVIHESYKFNGNWWDNGVGVSAQLNNQHNFYLEADYSVGDKFDKKQVNLGYRYAF